MGAFSELSWDPCPCCTDGWIDVHDNCGDGDLPRGFELMDGRIHVPCRDCNEEG